MTPTASSDATNKAYVDSVSQGIIWKDPVRVGTTTSGTLASDFENGDTIDGIVLATSDRILIKDQSNAVQNGIYTVNSSGAPTRATDMNSGSAENFERRILYCPGETASGPDRSLRTHPAHIRPLCPWWGSREQSGNLPQS